MKNNFFKVKRCRISIFHLLLGIWIGLTFWGISVAAPLTAAPYRFEIKPTAMYTQRTGDSKALSRSLAIFRAKRMAVEAAGKYYSQKELTFFGEKKEEIFNFAADNLAFELLQEKWQTVAELPTCTVSLKVMVQPSVFIEAEIESLKREKEEAAESYFREMEQPISKKLAPGHDIAKANRLIRKRALRVAIIYIDRLQKKYPNWPEVYEIKALACYLHNEPSQMKDALRKACELGSLSACEDHKMFMQKIDGD